MLKSKWGDAEEPTVTVIISIKSVTDQNHAVL